MLSGRRSKGQGWAGGPPKGLQCTVALPKPDVMSFMLVLSSDAKSTPTDANMVVQQAQPVCHCLRWGPGLLMPTICYIHEPLAGDPNSPSLGQQCVANNRDSRAAPHELPDARCPNTDLPIPSDPPINHPCVDLGSKRKLSRNSECFESGLANN